MKKIYILALSTLLAGASAMGAAKTNPAARFFKKAQTTMTTPGGFIKQTSEKKVAHNYAVSAEEVGDNAPSASVTDFEGWGYLNNTDGKSWLFTQTYTIGDNGFYSGSVVTIYDSDNQKQATVNIEIPDSIKVNSIEPYGTITTKFFDRDAKTWEFMVYLHIIGENYNNSGEIRAYNNNGELVQSYSADNALFFDATEGWTNYQRVVLVNSKEVDGEDVTELQVMKPCGWNEAPTVDHTFTVNSDRTVYSPGSYFNMFKVGGKAYYVVSYFEKDYFEDETLEDPVATADNHYLLDIYDNKYNFVKQVSVPVSPDTGALYDFPCFGAFTDSEDMSAGKFTGDDKFNFIVVHANYVVSSDGNSYTIKVYDEDSQEVATIEQGVSTWMKLSDIADEEEQYGFLVQSSSAETIEMVDIPSCLTVTTFPATIGDAQLSTNFDRYPNGDNGYQYVFGIGTGLVNQDGDVISRIGWYNPDLTLDHYASFNIGPDGEYFTPHITSTTLSPYTFNTDDTHEYIFLAKIKNTETNVIETKLMVGNDDGDILRTFEGDSDGKGDINLVSVFDRKILIAYYNYTTKNYAFDIFNLPFSKFEAGGDGTQESPYQIKTRGDLELIADDNDAYYELINDIDMSGTYWAPISQFKGSLDGKNHVIKGMTIANASGSTGLFGDIIGDVDGSGVQTNAVVKNLIFDAPKISVSSSSNNIGVVAGSAMAATLDNIHIYNAVIDGGTSGAKIGGISGDISLTSPVTSCSFNGAITSTESDKVGGIAGRLLTGSSIEACKSSGLIEAATEIGGIVGSTDSNGSYVLNSTSSMDLSGQNTIGGIVGWAGRSSVQKCYFNGFITATEKSRWDGYSVGGIIGMLTTDWSATKPTNKLFSGNFAANDGFTFTAGDEVTTTHRIVGYSAVDDDSSAEFSLDNNYANAEAKTYGVEKGVATTEGADKALDEADKEFFESLGFVYGNAFESPWKEIEDESFPGLYYENSVLALTLTSSSKHVKVDESIDLTATVYGMDYIREVDYTVSDEEVATLGEPDAEDNESIVTLTGKKAGTVVVTATKDGVSATCTIKVEEVEDSSVADAVADNAIALSYSNGVVYAKGATSIRVYSTTGALLASANKSSVKVVADGMIIAVATDAQGHRAVAKFIAK